MLYKLDNIMSNNNIFKIENSNQVASQYYGLLSSDNLATSSRET